MKIAVCATGQDSDSLVSSFFGRCPYYLIVEVNGRKKTWQNLENSAVRAGRGAGVAAAQIIASQKVEAVLCGGVGPNALSVLQLANIDIYLVKGNLKAEEALKEFQKGNLSKVNPSSIQGVSSQGGRGRGRGRNQF